METDLGQSMNETSETSGPARQGKPWSEEEDRQLYASFVAGKPLELIVASHERGKGGITSRLKRLGLIDRNGETIDPPPPFDAPEPAKKAPSMDLAFAVTTVDGWQVEIRSNRTLARPMIERLTLMLQGAVEGP